MVRRTRRLLAAIALLALPAVQCTAQAPQTPPPAPKTHLKAGDPAPEVALNDHNGKPFKLSDFKGKKNVVLAFYVLAFTGG